jgi:hypothetical protein
MTEASSLKCCATNFSLTDYWRSVSSASLAHIQNLLIAAFHYEAQEQMTVREEEER